MSRKSSRCVCRGLRAPAATLPPLFTWQSYAKEILADKLDEIQYDTVMEQVKAVGGANYGTGVRSK